MGGAKILENFITYLIDPAMLLIFTAGFFMFVWGLVQFLLNLDKGGENEDGKNHILWGIVGMVIMVSIYGIVVLLDNTFDLGAFSGTPDMSRYENINLPQNLFGGGQ